MTGRRAEEARDAWPGRRLALLALAPLASLDAGDALAGTSGRVQGQIAAETFEARVICEGPGSDGFFEIVPADHEQAGGAMVRMSGSARIGLAAVTVVRDGVIHDFTASSFEITGQRLRTASTLTESETGDRYGVSLDIECGPEEP